MRFLSRHAARIAAIGIIIGLYSLARLPQLPPEQRMQLAENFDFSQLALPAVPGPEPRFIRSVNPSLDHIAGWISAVGAAIALNDIDGDGLANDLCYVDTRTDQVIVAAVPDSGNRYAPFSLTAEPLAYDAKTTAPMGCIPQDMNEDGTLDLLVYYWGRPPIAFLGRQPGDYQPVEIAQSLERWFTNAATFTDLDGDGHVDLVVANYFADGAHILDAQAPEADFMQHSMSRAYNAGSTRFFLWQAGSGGDEPQVSFQEVDAGLSEIVNHAWTLALGAADLDGDLLPELYFANDFGPDRLLHNRSTPGQLQFTLLEGRRQFTLPASRTLGRDSFKGMGVDFADLNGDGHLDMFVSNIAAEYALEESHFLFVSTGDLAAIQTGVAPYVDQGELLGISRSSWAWDVKFADFNNDGDHEIIQTTGFLKGLIDRWPELQELALGNDELLRHPQFWPRFHQGDDLNGHVANPFYVRTHSGSYVNIATELGMAQPYVSRGIAVADVEGDGDLDFALANQWEASYFYRNDCPQCGNFLGLHVRIVPTAERLIATYPGHPQQPSSPAIGAAVTVTVPSGQRLVAQVDGGSGHSGKRSHDLHFGLGEIAANTPLAVQIRWRDRQGQPQQQHLNLSPGWHTIELQGYPS